MNSLDILILIKGEDKTKKVTSWRYDEYKPVVFVTYLGGKEYPYNISQFQIYKNPKTVLLADCIALKNGNPLNGVERLQFFEEYCRIIYHNNYCELVFSSSIKVVNSALHSPQSKNCFEYLKQIAIKTGLIVDGKNILASSYESIDFVREDSALAMFLCGQINLEPETKKEHIIYPFGFNISQKRAIENALCNPFSVIEGPPGTGKTQTILNIIANAVLRGESVAVVSNNNSATGNVCEKLKQNGVGFIAAPLGNSSNRKAFIELQDPSVPDMSSWRCKSWNNDEVCQEETELDQKLQMRNELFAIQGERDALEKEYAHFLDYYKTLSINGELPAFSKRVVASKILGFIAEFECCIQEGTKIGFFKKVAWKYLFGLKMNAFYTQPKETIISYCQNTYYCRRLKELEKRENALQFSLSKFDFDKRMKRYTELSMAEFKNYLARKYSPSSTRGYYDEMDLWAHSDLFIQDYPVVLSTAYSLRASLSNKIIYDYVIVDEASQVDLATGALAFSCAKKTVVVGDLKQLPNIVNQEQKVVTDDIFKKFALQEAYRYFDHSLLSAVVSLFPKAPRVLLREHYRCNSEIIGFCNQRFYNNELIVLTKQEKKCQPLVVYRTVAGNHARNHINQRQIDVIQNEVFPEQELNADNHSVGIITPYRNQANELQRVFADTTVEADTVDKFQGREKSVIIFSTVDNEIGDFASDPNRLNVAVSRAQDQLIVVTDGNENDHTSAIHELIGYIQYHNHEVINSRIHSVFDYLYNNYANERERILRKYGRVSEVDSENLMFSVIRDVLNQNAFSHLDAVLHVPLRMIINDYSKLNERELSFASNHLTHVDFLIYSKVTHEPVLVVEVDGFVYHNDEKQKERDQVKNTIFLKYGIPILRLSTVGSGEKQKLISELNRVVASGNY